MHKNFKFLEKANLPQNKVLHCVISEDATQAIEFLGNYGIKTFLTKKSNKLDDEIAFHTDIQFIYCGKNIAVAAPNQAGLIKDIKELGCRVEEEEIEPFSPYPNDVLLNQVILNDTFIGNVEYSSKRINNFLNENNITVFNTKQGYSKCSICIVNENAIITEDNGIFNLLKNSQINVLKIEPGFISLSDKHFGFLGGASGKISKTEIFFNGNIEEHPNYKQIIDFLNLYNVNPIYSKSYKLTDIGSIIPITELV